MRQPVNPDSLLAGIVERHNHLYLDVAMCVGIVVLVGCMVVGARALDDWLPLAMLIR
ncbi:hypothetical protein [Paraburkholderia unamae]|nr:hypothetical protein [Paraburkholderia unamae]